MPREITPPLPDLRRLAMQTDVALLIAPLEFALEEFPQQRVVAAGIRSITVGDASLSRRHEIRWQVPTDHLISDEHPQVVAKEDHAAHQFPSRVRKPGHPYRDCAQ